MKKIFTLMFFILMGFGLISAQGIKKQITYQLMVLDQTTGKIRANSDVDILVRVLEGSPAPDAPVVFSQSFHETTDATGTCVIMFELPDINTIDWSKKDYYFSTSIDGNAAGTSKITCVPQALYAHKAQSLTGVICKEELIGTWKCGTKSREWYPHEEKWVISDNDHTATFNADGTGEYLYSITDKFEDSGDIYNTYARKVIFDWILTNTGTLLLTEKTRESERTDSDIVREELPPSYHILIKISTDELFIPNLTSKETYGDIFIKSKS